MSNISYRYFFTIELLHKYFANGLCNDLAITPSLRTQASMRGSRIIARQYDNKLFTGIEIEAPPPSAQPGDPVKPFVVPPADLQLCYFLRLNNPLFFNYTNLPVHFTPGKVYYFTNRNNDVSNGKNFISKPATYDNAVTYQPGDIAIGAGGIIFQCINTCTGVTPTPAHNSNWMKIDNNRYSSEADALQWMPSISTYTFDTSQTNAVINVFGLNTATGDFTTNVFSKTIPFVPDAKSFSLNLSTLPPGKYKLNINGVVQWIYINDELAFNPAFAVIEIFNDSNLAAAYKLLDGGNLKSPVYTIHFLNRATIWKYILISSSKGSITVSPAGFGFPTAAASVIASLAPIPLSEVPLNVSLKLTTINGVPQNPAINVPSIACAAPRTLTYFKKGSVNYACSEIFLNH